MMLLNFKIDIKTKGFITCIFSFMLISYVGNAQEKEKKSEVKKEIVTEIEEVEIEEISEEKALKFIPFNIVESVPYPSECEGFLKNEERKKCVNKFLQNHMAMKFNFDLAQKLGLSSGKKRIFSQFKIDKSGKVVEIRVRGPHIALEEEVRRVINLLPEFIPAKHDEENVTVVYSLPFVFTVEEYEKKDGKQ